MRLRIATAMLGMAAGAYADDFTFARAEAVAEARLDGVRGGFELPTNLRASLTLERAAYANGELIARYSADVPDIANMTADQAEALATAAGTLIIQSGPANTFAALELGPASTVIQNTLNDQHLVALTTVSVTTNTLGFMKELTFHDGLRDVLGATAGVR